MATIIGTPGNDFLVGTADPDLILGLAGNDTELGLEGNDSLYGGTESDFIAGGKGNDLINGNEGDDTLNGNEDNDTVYGGQGNDIVYGGQDNDLLYGDIGNDTIYGDSGNDTLFGGSGNDLLYGGEGNDEINGNDGNDSVYGEGGNDLLYGGQGDDLIDGGSGIDTIFGNVGNDTIFGRSGDDYISGNDGNDYINGNEGNDTIYGGQGNDTIYGGQGNDIIYTDKGDDVASGNLGDDTIFGSQGNDLLNGNEGNDVLNGNEGNDTIYGGQGNDIVRGGMGNDWLFGDKGSDTLYGDLGADTLTGDSGGEINPDVFVVGLSGNTTAKTTGGATIADADVITDWQNCIDQISLTGGLSYADLVIAQGTGANAANTVISISPNYQGAGAGEYLVILNNVNANNIDGTDFIPAGPAKATILATDPFASEPVTTSGTPIDIGEFTISVPCPTDADLPITYTVQSGNTGDATPGSDYVALSGTAIIPKGSNKVTIPVTPIADTLVEGPETVKVTLNASGAGFQAGANNSAIVTILDAPPVVVNQPIALVTAPQPTITEGGTPGTLQFARSGGTNNNQQLTIKFILDTSGVTNNFSVSGATLVSGNIYSITIPANQSLSSLVSITSSSDGKNQPTEQIHAVILQDSAYTVGSQSNATLSITDNSPLTGTPNGSSGILRYNSSGAFLAQEADIQTAINDATVGGIGPDIIIIPAGDYQNQAINISKSVTLRGPNAGLSPGSGSLGVQAKVIGGSSQPVFAINTSDPVTIEGLTIQGNSATQNLIQGNISNTNTIIRQNQFIGTGPSGGGVIRLDYSNGSGSKATIVDNLIRDVSSSTVTSAIQAFRINNVAITNNVIANLKGSGILTDSITGLATITDNTVSNIGQDGIQLAGGNATISSNNITNVDLGPDQIPNSGDEDLNRGGIRLRNATLSTATLGNVNVTSNVITNSVSGFVIRPFQAGDPASAAVVVPNTVHVNQNNLLGNAKAGVLNGGTGGTLDATNNWWNVSTGPVVSGTGPDAITGAGANSVTFNPFATSPF